MGSYCLKGIEEIKISFLNIEDGRRYLAKKDIYINSGSDFDRASRLQVERIVSVEEYISFIEEQVLDWNSEEEAKLLAIMKNIINRMTTMKINIFKNIPKIYFIKTTGVEECDNAYCRENAIAIPVNIVNETTEELTDLIIHELFHIFSRNNSDIKNYLYEIIGFHSCPELEWSSELGYKITNPDAPVNNYYINVMFKDQSYKVIPILFSKECYKEDGRIFLNYINFRLIAVEVIDQKCVHLKKNGEIILFEPNEVIGYFEQIGKNSDYIIHPEELLADHFILSVNNIQDVPNIDILEKFNNIMRNL